MSYQDPPRRIGDRTDWILRILHAPAQGKANVPIVGKTRMMKACFLVSEKVKAETDYTTDFLFHANDYGPLDPVVYDALEHLEEQGLVNVVESQNYDGIEYELTEHGEVVARAKFEELDKDTQSLISWIKSKHVLSPLPKLLSFVYNQYPDMADRSVLKK